MNQRSKRSRDRKSQNIGASTFNTGGHVVSHSRTADPVVRTPQKATGDVPADKIKGAAKASPFFKKLKEVLPTTNAEEKKVIAKATEKVVEIETFKEVKVNIVDEKDKKDSK